MGAPIKRELGNVGKLIARGATAIVTGDEPHRKKERKKSERRKAALLAKGPSEAREGLMTKHAQPTLGDKAKVLEGQTPHSQRKKLLGG